MSAPLSSLLYSYAGTVQFQRYPHKLETDCYVLMLVPCSSNGTHIDLRLTATFLCWHHAAPTVPTFGFRLLLHLYAGTMQLQRYPQRLETDGYIFMLTPCRSNGTHRLQSDCPPPHTLSLCKEFPQLV